MKNRFLIIFISIFVGVVLIFGGVLGTIAIVRNAGAAVKYDGVIADKGEVTYLASYYKMQYIRSLRLIGVNAKDSQSFWDSKDESGKTYGELFEESFADYLASLLVANRIFLDYSSYTSDDKKTVSNTVDEILRYYADGSTSEFNSAAEKYGFDYKDFCNAAELLYKAERSQEVIYGAGGSNLVNFPEECEKYLDTYSHVSLIFIRTEELLVRDEEGNFVYDESGNVAVRDMTAEEKAVREDMINTLTNAMEARENGTNLQITPEMFEIYLKKSDGDMAMNETGYYFHSSAETTAEFAEAFPEVVERALSMELYDYEKVDCSIGVCFIYKYDITEGAYSDSDNLFFSDFYSDASNYLYREILKELAPDVEFKDKYSEIDVVSIPMVDEFYVRGWTKD